MLLIFDLDDTLIDTTNSITKIKLERAFFAMIKAGLKFPDIGKALSTLKRLDASFISTRNTLQEFVEMHDAPLEFLEIALAEVYGSLDPDISVDALEGAREVLMELEACHKLALVTLGHRSLQMEKMKKAGIDSELFSKIIVSEERNKKPHYESIAREFYTSSSEILVCGDRIPYDLTPAKQLGFRTVQMLWGRGLVNFGNKGDVDFTISKLTEIKEIIKKIHL